MEKLNLEFIKPQQARVYNFYMIPKMIVTHTAFNGLDYGSKLLYGIMLSKASLSAQNGNYIDVNGNLYIIYTINQVMDDMNCCRSTAVKMLNQLENIGLIIKKKRGQGIPTLIYVMDCSGV